MFLKIRNILLFVILMFASSIYASGRGDDMPDLSGLSIHDCNEHECETARASATGRGSSGKWLDNTTPKTAWTCREIEDYSTPTKTCEMCERETIRYGHKMKHPTYLNELEVGCICAGHMEGDVLQAKNREKYFQSRIGKRARFVEHRSWKISARGNSYINYKDHNQNPHNVVVIKTRRLPYKYSANVGATNIGSWHDTIQEAKLAAFDVMWPTKKCILH